MASSRRSIARRLASKLNRLLRKTAGLEITRVPRPRVIGAFDPTGKFNVGAGLDRPPNFIHCDPRPLPGISLVCEAWEISRFTHDAEHIYCRHMLEHLTLAEVRATLSDWFDALRVDGTVHLIVPNLDFHIRQWNRASWNTEALSDPKNDARYSLAGFYGWQHECDPTTTSDYRPTYWDVHKCGFNPPLLTLLLEEAGFTNVKAWVADEVHLHAQATKSVRKGERQVAPTLAGIRSDHVARYEFAAARLKGRGTIVDAACGIGYGSRLIADRNPSARITALDRDLASLAYAQKHYGHLNVDYQAIDLDSWSPNENSCDAVVSFETIEHLAVAPKFLTAIGRGLRPEGLLLCSTPDQSTNPFARDRFPFHIRHYTADEFHALLSSSGLSDIELYSQNRLGDVSIRPYGKGDFIIAVGRRSS